jgi:hypothetical protein
MLVSAGSVLRLPAGHKDKLTSVRIFNLNGKMLGSLQMENGRILDLKRMGTGGKGLVIDTDMKNKYFCLCIIMR